MRALETSIVRPQQIRILRWSRGRKWVQSEMEPLKHSFLDFTQVWFRAGQEEENEFSVPGHHLKHRVLDLTKVEFWGCQEAEKVF